MAARETAVLSAGVAGGAGENEHLARVAETLAHATRVSGGRVALRREGGEPIALFPSPDAALRAALRLHSYMLALPRVYGKAGMRLSVHYGPVGQGGEDIAGETVDAALELLEAAAAGEALISEHAAAEVGPGLRRFVGAAFPGAKGAARLELGQVLSGGTADIFLADRAPRLRLRLDYRSMTLVRRREGDAATIGSDAACDLAVEDSAASGRHCTILRSRGACILRDHSAAGTFVTLESGREFAVRDAEIRLAGRGLISFGRPRARSEEVVQYACEG